MDESELMRLAVRGILAGAVTSELAAPLERIARVLEAAVDRLDRHVARSRGPEPLPYHTVGEVRERVAEAFLAVGRASRLAADLAVVAATARPRTTARVDVNELVERALLLSRHRFAADAEVLLDLGTLPSIEVDGVRVALALAQLLVIVASASGPAATVVVHTAPAARGLRVSVYHPGPPAPSSPFTELVRKDLEAEGGTLTYTKDGLRSLALVELA